MYKFFQWKDIWFMLAVACTRHSLSKQHCDSINNSEWCERKGCFHGVKEPIVGQLL